jgi:putative PEP-CTERM system histidine kinase
MNVSVIIPCVTGFFCFALAVFVLFRDRRPLVHRIFVAGMMAFGCEAFLTALSLRSLVLGEILFWQRLRMIATALLPGCWLLFALSFGRVNAKIVVKKFRWVWVGSLVVLLTLSSIFQRDLLRGTPYVDQSLKWTIALGPAGYLFYISFIAGAILILMGLEETLRSAVGQMRWQIKFVILGLGGIFAFRLYSGSQILLFSSINSNLEMANIGTLLVACVFVAIAFNRLPALKIDVYFSRSFLYGSLTILVAGMYFIVVGLLAKIASYLHLHEFVYVEAFWVFLAFLGLGVLFLSERVKRSLKQFVSLHFKRPHYDYRKEWMDFTHATTSMTEMKLLSSAVAKKVSRTFDAPSASIWLLDETGEDLELGGSTALTDERGRNLVGSCRGWKDLIAQMREQHLPVDFSRTKEKWAIDFAERNTDYLGRASIRFCVPLSSGGELLGILTMGDRVAEDPYSPEDIDLLRTLSDQTAGMLLNLKLFERLRKAKETEAIQTMAAFMMHDLKNLASMLSLTVENLPVHYDNPEFRNDAVKLFRQSVVKIEDLCSQLVLMSQKIELKPKQVDLNSLVARALAGLNGKEKICIVQDLCPMPKLMVDGEQIQKVLTNLVLNAKEAIDEIGEIHVKTGREDSWVVLCVSDTGCGMSKEFMEKSLFRPFKTTKKRGMGIGLYHSQMIVEAHHGKIEVESEIGRGTTFRVYLPTKSM